MMMMTMTKMVTVTTKITMTTITMMAMLITMMSLRSLYPAEAFHPHCRDFHMRNVIPVLIPEYDPMNTGHTHRVRLMIMI